MALAREGVVVPDRATAPSLLAGKALSAREREVWRLMAEGCSDAEIADRLALNGLTVRFHLSNVLAKLGAASGQEAQPGPGELAAVRDRSAEERARPAV
jgi:DNA-binding CsgD family transcriptional regulator